VIISEKPKKPRQITSAQISSAMATTITSMMPCSSRSRL
jgi:hypothetical protein